MFFSICKEQASLAAKIGKRRKLSFIGLASFQKTVQIVYFEKKFASTQIGQNLSTSVKNLTIE